MTKARAWQVGMVMAAALTVTALKASGPVGLYSRVDHVVLEPNDQEPMEVQIWGAFSLAVPRTSEGQPRPADGFGTVAFGNVYAAVQTGYLYYTCPKGKESTCQAEWRDLLSVAGKPDVVGFGARWTPQGRVRPATERPASPDLYTLNIGVVKIGRDGSGNTEPYAELIKALGVQKKVVTKAAAPKAK